MEEEPTSTIRFKKDGREFKGKITSDVPWRPPFEDEKKALHPQVQGVLDRPRVQSRTMKWFEEKDHVISGTNASGVILSNPKLYGKPFDCVREKSPKSFKMAHEEMFWKKTGRERKFLQNANCRHGTHTEPEAASAYSFVTGIELVTKKDDPDTIEDIGLLHGNTLRIKDHDDCITQEIVVPSYIGATPDAMAKYHPILVEIKCPAKKTIEHKVPEYYYAQMQWQMAVTGILECHFVQYKPPNFNDSFPGIIDILVVKFDLDWFKLALIECEKFWQRVVDYYKLINKPLGSKSPDFDKELAEITESRKRKYTPTSGTITFDDRVEWSKVENIEDYVERQPFNLLVKRSKGLGSLARSDDVDLG
jgi:hypothetical protein